MKKLLLLLCPLILTTGCFLKKSETAFSFLGCQLAKVEATGAATWTDDYTYNSAGVKTQWVKTQSSGDYSETYTYDSNGKLSKVTSTYGTIDLIYSSGKLIKTIHKDLGGNLNYTQDVTYASNVITYTGKNPSAAIIFTDVFTMNGQDMDKEAYKEYFGSGGTLSFSSEYLYSQYDTYYNPEYLSDAAIYPASFHNYKRIDITNTDYSSGSPVESVLYYSYTVIPNQSNAIAYRERTRSDTGAILIRTYTYNKCK